MSLYQSFFIVNFALIFIINAEKQFPGKCPGDVKAISDFDVEQFFIGNWYQEQEISPKNPFSDDKMCFDICFTIDPTSNTKITTTVTYSDTNNEKHETSYCVIVPDPNCGQFSIEGSKMEQDSTAKPLFGNYSIIGTDYTSYVVYYSCNESDSNHTIGIWIQTRDKNPSNETMSKAYEVMHKYNLEEDWLTWTNGDCTC